MKRMVRMQAVLSAAVGLALCVTGCAGNRLGGAGAVRGMIPQLVSVNVGEREEAHQAMMASGTEAVPVLEKYALGGGPVQVRQAAIRELGEFARFHPEAQTPALEALADIYVKNDPATVGAAATALRAVGAPAIAYLAKAVAAAPLEAESPGAIPAWRHPMILMLAIDRRATLDVLVGMLGDPAYAEGEATIVGVLGNVTQVYFPYDPKASPEVRQGTIRKWQEWWKAQGSASK